MFFEQFENRQSYGRPMTISKGDDGKLRLSIKDKPDGEWGSSASIELNKVDCVRLIELIEEHILVEL